MPKIDTQSWDTVASLRKRLAPLEARQAKFKELEAAARYLVGAMRVPSNEKRIDEAWRRTQFALDALDIGGHRMKLPTWRDVVLLELLGYCVAFYAGVLMARAALAIFHP